MPLMIEFPVIALSDFKSLAGDVTCEPDTDGVTFYVVRSLIRRLLTASYVLMRDPTGLTRIYLACSGSIQSRHKYLCNATKFVRQSGKVLFLFNLCTWKLLESFNQHDVNGAP